MASGSGSGGGGRSSHPPQWSPTRSSYSAGQLQHDRHGGSASSSAYAPAHSPDAIDTAPRSGYVPEVVIPSRSSSSAAASPSRALSPTAYASAGSGLLRPPSQQARYQQQHSGPNGSGASSPIVAYPAPSYASGQAGPSARYSSAYDAPPPPSAPTASQEDSLADVMGSAGVDLRAEEEAMQSQTRFGSQSHSQHSTSSYGHHARDGSQRDRGRDGSYSQSSQGHGSSSSSSQPKRGSSGLFLEVYPLSMKVHSIAAMHGLGVEPDVLNYLSLTARTRFRNLTEAMIAAARHRIWASAHARPPPLFDEDARYASASANARRKGKARDANTATAHTEHEPKPMYHEQLLSDPAKQLSALEKVEREEEARARRRRAARIEREAAERAFLAALVDEERSGEGVGREGWEDGVDAMTGVEGGPQGSGGAGSGDVPNGHHLPLGGNGGVDPSALAGDGKKAVVSPAAAAAGGASAGAGTAGAGASAKGSKKGRGEGGEGGEGGPKKKRQKKNPAGGEAGGTGTGASAGGAAGPNGALPGTTGAAPSRSSKKHNLSEDVQKRLTDSTATQLIGGKAYGWMTAGAAGGGAGKGAKGAKGGAGGAGIGAGAKKGKLPAPKFGSESAKLAAEEKDGSSAAKGGNAFAGGGGGEKDGKEGVSQGRSPSKADGTVRKRSDSTAGGGGGGGTKSSLPTKPSNTSTSTGSGALAIGAWGDVAARKAAREEAERQRRLRVQMRDALFVLEEEVSGGGVPARGSGVRALLRARARMGGVGVVNPFEQASSASGTGTGLGGGGQLGSG